MSNKEKKHVIFVHGDALSGKTRWIREKNLPFMWYAEQLSVAELVAEVHAFFGRNTKAGALCIEMCGPIEKSKVEAMDEVFIVSAREFRRHDL